MSALLTLSLKLDSLSHSFIATNVEEKVDCLPLELLNDGQEARIVDVCGDSVQVHRLAEIGIRCGSLLKMIRHGEPCLLAVDGRRLSLRLCAGINIFVSSLNLTRVAEAC